MQNYQKLIQQLSQQKSNSDEVLISIYMDLGDLEDKSQNIGTKLKAQIQEALKDHPKFVDHGFYRNYLSGIVLEMSEQIDLNYSGVGLFLRVPIDTSNLAIEQYDKDLQATMIPMTHLLYTKTTISEVYDLGLLMDNEVSDISYLIVDINRDNTIFYEFRQSQISFLKSLRNRFFDDFDEMQPEERKEYMPMQGWFNIGEDVQWIVEEDKRYLHEVKNEIEKAKPQSKVMILHSSIFEKIKPDLESIVNIDGVEISFKNRQVDTYEHFQAYLTSLASADIIDKKKKLLQTARQQYQLFVEGWEHVIKAANLNQIDTLFVHPDQEVYGSRLDDDTLEVGGEGAGLLLPLVYYKLINSSSKVVMLQGQEFRDQGQIMALKRFNLDLD
jgi:hypothetical protein